MATVRLGIEVDAKGAVTSVRELSGASDQLGGSLKRTSGSVSGLSSVIGGFKIGAGIQAFNLIKQAVEASARAIPDFVAHGSEVSAVSAGFERLAAAVGESGRDIVSSAQNSSQGLISAFDIMSNANKGFLLGLPITAKEMGTLSQTAVALGQVMKVGPGQALNDLITGLGRGSAAILDNLGITVKAQDAYDAYAAQLGKTASELTDGEKKLAIYQAAMGAAGEAVDRVGGIHLTTRERVQQAGVIFSDLRDRLATIVAETPALNVLFAGLTDILAALAKMVRENEGTIRRWVEAGVVFAAQALVQLVKIGGVVVDAWSGMKIMLISLGAEFERWAATVLAAKDMVAGNITVAEAFQRVKEAEAAALRTSSAAIAEEMKKNGERQSLVERVQAAVEGLRDSVANSVGASSEASGAADRLSGALRGVADGAAGAGAKVTDLEKALEKAAPKMRALSGEAGALAMGITGARTAIDEFVDGALIRMWEAFKQGPIAEKVIDGIKTKTEETRKPFEDVEAATIDWHQALQDLGAASQLFGENFGGVLTKLSGGITTIAAQVDNLKKVFSQPLSFGSFLSGFSSVLTIAGTLKSVLGSIFGGGVGDIYKNTEWGRALSEGFERQRQAIEGIKASLTDGKIEDAIALMTQSGMDSAAVYEQLGPQIEDVIAAARARWDELTEAERAAIEQLEAYRNDAEEKLERVTEAVNQHARSWENLASKIAAAGGTVPEWMQGGGGARPPRPFSHGGVVSSPTFSLTGEAGPEAIIPLTKPRRAAEVMAQAGLPMVVEGGPRMDRVEAGLGALRRELQGLRAEFRSLPYLLGKTVRDMPQLVPTR